MVVMLHYHVAVAFTPADWSVTGPHTHTHTRVCVRSRPDLLTAETQDDVCPHNQYRAQPLPGPLWGHVMWTRARQERGRTHTHYGAVECIALLY